jgi:DNA-binding ferritin-like protein
MKNALLVVLLVLAVVAAAGLGMWGNEQRVGKDEMLKVLQGLHLDAQGAPAEAAADEGAAPAKDGLSPEGMGREIQRALDNLRTELDLAQGKIAAQQTEIEEYRGRVQSAEQRVDVVARSARQRAEVAAESARAETAEQIVDARRETDQAIREKVKISNELAALQTKYDELKSSYDALLAATDEFLADVKAGEGEESEEEAEPAEDEGEGEVAEPETDESADAGEDAAPDRADEVLASIPETPETADDSAQLTELEGTKVGMSRYFLAIVFDESDGTLRFTLQNGEVLVYEGVSGTLAERIRMAGNSVDATYDHLVKEKLPCDRKESAVWKAYAKWAQKEAELIEAVWVTVE